MSEIYKRVKNVSNVFPVRCLNCASFQMETAQNVGLQGANTFFIYFFLFILFLKNIDSLIEIKHLFCKSPGQDKQHNRVFNYNSDQTQHLHKVKAIQYNLPIDGSLVLSAIRGKLNLAMFSVLISPMRLVSQG